MSGSKQHESTHEVQCLDLVLERCKNIKNVIFRMGYWFNKTVQKRVQSLLCQYQYL